MKPSGTKNFDTSLWERRLEEEFDEREKMRESTLAGVIPKLRRYFKDKQVERVYLGGSLLRKGHFYDFSDVDVVVEGFSESPFRAAAELERKLERTVDLISLEECRFRKDLLRCAKRIL